jgi:drug/metabolite transporter (DMT)-like permease
MNRAAVSGVLAILLWSSTIGVSRNIQEALGTFTAGTAIYILAGCLACMSIFVRYRSLKPLFTLPPRYLMVCGGLFVGYITCLYVAVGLASDHQQVLVVGMINYLWPALILLLAIPILGQRAHLILAVGMVLALIGVGLALGGTNLNPSVLTANMFAYGLMFCGAICWALYTNFSRRWLRESAISGVALFILASGCALGLMRLAVDENSAWSMPILAQVIYMAVGPGWLAYTFWDVGIRRGPIILLTNLSYFTPLFSTFLSVMVLRTQAGANLWLAALLIIAGAALSQYGSR